MVYKNVGVYQVFHTCQMKGKRRKSSISVQGTSLTETVRDHPSKAWVLMYIFCKTGVMMLASQTLIYNGFHTEAANSSSYLKQFLSLLYLHQPQITSWFWSYLRVRLTGLR